MILSTRIRTAIPISQLFVTALFFAAAHHVQAAEKVAVFNLEIQYGDPVPGAPQKKEIEQQRLVMISDRLRSALSQSGRFEVVDIAPVHDKAAAANLQACGNCGDDLARTLGAHYAVTGVVNKMSELILSMNVMVRDAKTGSPVTSAVVDLRGNTDESWRRAIDYLYENVLSPRLERAIP